MSNGGPVLQLVARDLRDSEEFPSLAGSEYVTVVSERDRPGRPVVGRKTIDQFLELEATRRDAAIAVAYASLDPCSSAFGAVGDGVTDDSDAWISVHNFSALTGLMVDGRGRSYGFDPGSGGGGWTVPDGITTGNWTIVNLRFDPAGDASVETRPLYINAGSDFHIHDAKIDKNGAGDKGGTTWATAMFSNSSDFTINGLEVTGDGKGTAIVFASCSDFIADGLFVHDMLWQKATDPGAGGEQMNGIRFGSCDRGLIQKARVMNLLGQIASGTPLPYECDGIDCNDNRDLVFESPLCYYVFEGMDCSGSGMNERLTINNGRMLFCHAAGYKFTSNNSGHRLNNCTAKSCGLVGFTFATSGISPFIVDDIVCTNCLAQDAGDTTASGGHWSGSALAGWYVTNAASDPAKGVGNLRLHNCSAVDRQGSPTMLYAMLVENLPGESCRPKLTGWHAAGWTTGEFADTSTISPPLVDGCLPWHDSGTISSFTLGDGVGSTIATGVTYRGAALGDTIEVTANADLKGCRAWATISATNTIGLIRILNQTGSSQTIADVIFSYRIRKKFSN